MYNDGECFEHNIQWRTSEIGDECPACKAEAERDTATQEAETRRENLETMIQRLLKTEAERDALKDIVCKYGFAVVLSGETGFRHLRCRDCGATNESKSGNELISKDIKHRDGCKLDAALKAGAK